jgi:hypothetical protein
MISSSRSRESPQPPRISPAMAVALLALFVALGGSAWALSANSVTSRHIVDDTIRTVDVKDGKGVTGADVVDESVTSTDIGADAIQPDEIGADAVGFSELAAGAFNADITEQGTAFGVPNDGIQGFEVEDETLSGADVDESTLSGVVRGRGDSPCCTIRGGILHTELAYSAADPTTFIDLGAFELRSTPAGDPDKLAICNPPGGVNFGASDVLYTGGGITSTAETRSRTTLPTQGTCRTIDVNGSNTVGSGDFRMYLPERAWEATEVRGVSFGTGSGFTIFATSLH